MGILRSVAGSVAIGFVIFILLLSFAPDSVPFSSNNYGWNGIEQVSSTYNINPIASVSLAQSSTGSVLLVIAPTTPFSQYEARTASEFVSSGGTLVISDRSGMSNSLLEGMNVSIRIDNNIVRDPLYNWKSPELPIAISPSGISREYSFLAGVQALALNDPSTLTLNSSSARPVALSSPLSISYQTNGSSFAIGKAEQTGEFVLAAVQKLGLGQVIVIGDSTFFTNSMWKNANNQQIIKNLFANSTVYLDTSHWPLNVGESLKAQLLGFYSRLKPIEFTYLFTSWIVLTSLLILPVFSSAFEVKPRQNAFVSDGKYNEKILSRIRKDREKYGTRFES